ncbi:hypothetical protein HS7_06690 [Sulfolobales archaeon HS-7]|nr:hypothetical protein HS7_06690 [Sulfolobales archaeon HS-7]
MWPFLNILTMTVTTRITSFPRGKYYFSNVPLILPIDSALRLLFGGKLEELSSFLLESSSSNSLKKGKYHPLSSPNFIIRREWNAVMFLFEAIILRNFYKQTIYYRLKKGRLFRSSNSVGLIKASKNFSEKYILTLPAEYKSNKRVKAKMLCKYIKLRTGNIGRKAANIIASLGGGYSRIGNGS